MMNLKKPQHEEDIVIQFSARGLSEEKFAELASKIQLFLSQETETHSSECVERKGTIRKIFSEGGYEISSSFPHPVSSSAKKGFESSSFAPLNSFPKTTNLGPRKLPESTPCPQKQLKIGNDMKSDHQEKNVIKNKVQPDPVCMNIESSVEISDDDMNSSVELKGKLRPTEEDSDCFEGIINPEFNSSMSLKEMLDQAKKAKKRRNLDRSRDEKSRGQGNQMKREHKTVKKEVSSSSKKGFKEDAVDRVFNPSLKHQSQESSEMLSAEIIISDGEWAFQDTYFSPMDQSSNKENHENSRSSISSERKTNVCKSDKNASGKKATAETIKTTKSVFVEKTQKKIVVQDSTNENSPNAALDDDCRIECHDPKQDAIMAQYLRRSKPIFRPTERLVGQYDHPGRGSILIDE